MPKLFVISDVHGFFDELKEALDKAGFDPNNEDHWLISCGDYLDRGHKPQEIIDYLSSLDRVVLVKGNHEDLILDCIDRGFPYSNDMSNMTFHSICDLAPNAKTFGQACAVAYAKVKPFVDKMVNYLETENYIFVHSFIPLRTNGTPQYYKTHLKHFEFDHNWREAHEREWSAARWGNPYELAEQGLLPEKTLVFGHFHTSWPRHKYHGEPEYGEGANFDIYHGDGYIAIDGCTALTGQVNVLVLEDEFITKPLDNH